MTKKYTRRKMENSYIWYKKGLCVSHLCSFRRKIVDFLLQKANNVDVDPYIVLYMCLNS